MSAGSQVTEPLLGNAASLSAGFVCEMPGSHSGVRSNLLFAERCKSRGLRASGKAPQQRRLDPAHGEFPASSPRIQHPLERPGMRPAPPSIDHLCGCGKQAGGKRGRPTLNLTRTILFSLPPSLPPSSPLLLPTPCFFFR